MSYNHAKTYEYLRLVQMSFIKMTILTFLVICLTEPSFAISEDKIASKVDELIEAAGNNVKDYNKIVDFLIEQFDKKEVEKGLLASKYYSSTKTNVNYITYPYYRGVCDVVYLANKYHIIQVCIDISKNEIVQYFSHGSVKKTVEDYQINPRSVR